MADSKSIEVPLPAAVEAEIAKKLADVKTLRALLKISLQVHGAPPEKKEGGAD